MEMCPFAILTVIRWFYSSPLGFQFSLRSSTKSWPHAIRKDGQQHGRTVDRSQRLWSYLPLC